MTYQAQYAGCEGEKAKFVTAKGDWFMFISKGAEGIRGLQPGTPVTIDAAKPEGKNYWRLNGFTAGGAVQTAQPQTAAQAWAAPLAPKPVQTLSYVPDKDTPPILSNVLAHAIAAGVLTRPEELAEWAKWTNEAIKSFHAGVQQRSPGNAARNPDPYPTGDNMEAPPMGDPNDPGYQ